VTAPGDGDDEPAPDRGREDEFDPDSLDGLETPMSRFLGRGRWVVALVLAIALAFPVGGWLLDEVAFRGSGDAVEAELGDSAFLADAVVLVRSIDCGGVVSTGSAFAVEIDGEALLVTNRHVVDGARTIGVRPLDGGPSVRVEAHGLSDLADVAVLELGEAAQLPEPLPSGDVADIGDEVRVIGFPGGRAATSTGPVAMASGDRMILDLQVDAGASGSPVLDGDGKVVGQVFARTSQGTGVATPLPRLLEAAAQVRPEDATC
jgi:S1-C subfamily serine protease